MTWILQGFGRTCLSVGHSPDEAEGPCRGLFCLESVLMLAIQPLDSRQARMTLFYSRHSGLPGIGVPL